MKIVTIVENDAITGVRYGTVEIPYIEVSPRDRDVCPQKLLRDTNSQHAIARHHYNHAQKLRADNIQRAASKQRTRNK